MTLTRWLHSYLRACLITGSPAQAWRSGRPYLPGAAPWLRGMWMVAKQRGKV